MFTLEVLSDQLIIRSSYQPRHQWKESFKVMAEAGDDQLLDAELFAE
jgi:hypothetical protein